MMIVVAGLRNWWRGMALPVVLAAVLLLSGQMPTVAQAQCVNYATAPRILASTPGFPDCNDIATRGDTLFMACADSGLLVAVLQPDHTVEVIGRAQGSYGGLQRVTVLGARAYAVSDWAGLQIYDIADAANPVWLGFVDTPGLSADVAALPDRAFVSDDFLGLVVIDTVSPTRRISAILAMPGILTRIELSGHLLYCGVHDGTTGADILVVVDVTHPDQPVIIGQLSLAKPITDIAADAQKVVVVSYDRLLQVIDVSNPSAPVTFSELAVNYGASRVSLRGDLALVNLYAQGLGVVDLADPVAPKMTAMQRKGGAGYRCL